MAIEDPYVPVFMLVLFTIARSDFRQFISNVSIVHVCLNGFTEDPGLTSTLGYSTPVTFVQVT